MQPKDELQPCESCRGQKQYMGLGMIMKDCMKCSGIGWVKAPVAESPIAEPVVVVEKPKRGRRGKKLDG